jgi:sterol desaturase/sphingolipid hydroxylase (fatty acid hydroxylase superfamily)
MPNFVSNRDESVRLFKNPFLEYFSHIHPATPLVVYIPVVILSEYFGFKFISNTLYGIIFTFFGIFLWTLLEYLIHRFAFHYLPKSERGKKIHFLVHGVHHDYPRDSTRLVMPLPVSIPLALIFFFIFKAVFGIYYLNIFSGLVIGYMAYDSIHYATHHFKMQSGISKFLKEYHLKHHYAGEDTAYGVSNPLWDYVFRTVPGYIKDKNK